ncbi:MAG: 4Fe-4S cluster-binding domain-containing protein [Clostridia bacterium]|nr:4Fe-4S cluster-binding domain-containing protein [Clostridia bacterium]
MEKCELCPRKCGVDRQKNKGFCRVSDRITLGRAGLHFWEEPCISGYGGSGAIFFSGCNMGCIFCQNMSLSRGEVGKEVTEKRLREIFYELIDEGADNINLVTPTHFVPEIVKALSAERLPVPVVYNTSSYEDVNTLRMLDGFVDIYLPDLKYKDSSLSAALSRAPDYYERAVPAIKEMVRQTGAPVFDDEGMMLKGTIIRHLVLPGYLNNTYDIIDAFGENFNGRAMFSLMSQYTPPGTKLPYESLNRRLTEEEYEKAVDYMYLSGIEDGFLQELSSAKEEYTPAFDLTGI